MRFLVALGHDVEIVVKPDVGPLDCALPRTRERFSSVSSARAYFATKRALSSLAASSAANAIS